MKRALTALAVAAGLCGGAAFAAQSSGAPPSVTFETTVKVDREKSAFILCSEKVSEQEASAEALAICDAAVAEAPDNGDAYYYRGYARYFLQDYGGAEADFSSAIEKGARRLAESYYQRGACKERQRRLREAAADFKAAHDLKPDWGQARRKVEDYQWAYE